MSKDLGTSGKDSWKEPMESALEQLLVNLQPYQRVDFLNRLSCGLQHEGPALVNQSPYQNTIPEEEQENYPGDLELEAKIENLVRWNAMAMVVAANKKNPGIGGHISTFASSATLYEVGQNHFFHGGQGSEPADLVYFQGHASPGNYARAYLEGRLQEDSLTHFRQDLKKNGLSSYPHPFLMPDFWQFPTVSMGLGPVCSIYQSRFSRYLQARGLTGEDPQVWAFVGDGEMDEPETLGALPMASRENLNNLTWVVDCNLQRLDGPVRGNEKIIQELERIFRGAGWNVLKVIWSSDWDDLFRRDAEGILQQRLEECVDGDFQNFSAADGTTIRRELFNTESLRDLVRHLPDEELGRLRRGGHDPVKVFSAYRAAREHRAGPTVILAKTVKGFGLGESGAGLNTTHQQKKLEERDLRAFRDRFDLPISDERIAELPFYRPPENSPEMKYLRERREKLGGFLPARKPSASKPAIPGLGEFQEFLEGDEKGAATTMAFVRMLNSLMRHEEFGERVVPIIPDEARTFGLDALFRQYGIYAHSGQKYTPVDHDHVLYYREDKEGQILEEGITEAGSMGSFIAAGTSYSTRNLEMIPFFLFYSMFGFQRVGDLIWAAGDSLSKGFLLGCTAGRTTLNGEGLQHQDGHSPLIASVYPNIKAYDPAFAYEIAVIVQDGLRRMIEWNESVMYYLTLYNEPLSMPAMPEGVTEGILDGLYRFKQGTKGQHKAHILASGTLMGEALKAADLLGEKCRISCDIWSATSYQQLRLDALEAEKWNREHPDRKPRKPKVEQILQDETGPFVAVSDYVKLVPGQIAQWIPGDLTTLGTDGFGRSGTKADLRRFFEIDAEHIARAVVTELLRKETINREEYRKALDALNFNRNSEE